MPFATLFASSSRPLVTWLAHNLNITDDDVSRTIVVLLTIFAVTWYLWLFCFKREKGSPPGPIGLPIVGSLPFIDPNLHIFFANLARIYGPVLKLKLGSKIIIVVTSDSVTREILKDQDATFANRDVPVAGRCMYGGMDMIWSPQGPVWRAHRKASMVKMLGVHALDSASGLRMREFRRTVQHMYRVSKAGSAVNIGLQMFMTALNVVTSQLWGEILEGEARDVHAEKFKHVIAEMTILLAKPNISDFFPNLARFDLQSVKKDMDKCVDTFDKIFDAVIEQRLKMGDKGNDFVQFLLKLKAGQTDAETSLDMNGLKALLMDMVLGGTETSASTAEFAMSEVINNPRILIKIQEELDTVIGKNRMVEDSDVSKLPYIHAITKEALRLHPPAPLLAPHCPSKDAIVGGYIIPKGAQVSLNVWAIHRDPTLWENPTEFIPERFLDGSGKGDYSGKDFGYMPFGAGRRICPGLQMAERMEPYFLATVFHCFDWKLPEGKKKVDLSENFGLVMRLKFPLIAYPVPRLSDPTLYQ